MDRDQADRGILDSDTAGALADSAFRRAHGMIVARLTRALGAGGFDLAQDAAQHALLQALRHWRSGSIPDDPNAWLFRVARNHAIDELRRRRRAGALADAVAALPFAAASDGYVEKLKFDREVIDDQLALIFACCHPALPAPARLALTLKSVCGLGVVEIAATFLSQPSAIEQRLVRAKRLIRERGIAFAVPGPDALADRLASVLDIIYLLFSEGYVASTGPDATRDDLAREAIRLAELLTRNPVTDVSAVHALMALMLFQYARRPARIDEAGELVLLAQQDRQLWDGGMIERGHRHMLHAMTSAEPGLFHIQAAIAAQHVMAPRYEDTDWREIAGLYDRLTEIAPNPIVALNRALALAECDGPAAGLEAIEAIGQREQLNGHPPYWIAMATLNRRLGRHAPARAALRAALALDTADPLRRYLRRELATLTDKT